MHETMSVSEFKARCLAVFERIANGGDPVTITKRGVPIAQVGAPPGTARPKRELGRLRGSMRIHGDVVGPVADADEWEALG